MFVRRIRAGTTDVSVVIRIIDSADGTPETGVVFNTAGIDLEYRREGAASVDITEATLAALTTAHTDGGFLHIGNGYYRLDLPDAACAAGATGVLVHGTVTGMIVIGTYLELVAYDPQDTVRLGLTALPGAAAESAGGLYTRGSGAGQIAQPANGLINVNTTQIEGTDATDQITASVPTVGAIADQVYDEPIAGHQTAGTYGAMFTPANTGTAQAGGASTITLAATASSNDDHYNTDLIVIIAGTGAGQPGRIVADYVGSTRVATMTSPWLVAPDNTSVYAVFQVARA